MEVEKFVEEAIKELSRGALDHCHPFRYFTLATVADDLPDQRMVVLRGFDSSSASFVIYTDRRSAKVGQLSANRHSHALFWHPKKKLQIRARLGMELLAPTAVDVSSVNLNDYNSILAPGTASGSAGVDYGDTLNLDNFQPLRFDIQSVDVLHLDRPHHRRALGVFENGRLVKASWLVP